MPPDSFNITLAFHVWRRLFLGYIAHSHRDTSSALFESSGYRRTCLKKVMQRDEVVGKVAQAVILSVYLALSFLVLGGVG